MTVCGLIDVTEQSPFDTWVVFDDYALSHVNRSLIQNSTVGFATDLGVHRWVGRHGDRNERFVVVADEVDPVNGLVQCRLENS